MLGVIGGSGFYTFFDSAARSVNLDTPFGEPSAPVTVGAADAVGVVIGEVDPDDQCHRDGQGQQRLPPVGGVQPGGGASARDHRCDCVR